MMPNMKMMLELDAQQLPMENNKSTGKFQIKAMSLVFCEEFNFVNKMS
jgi:hypothetical protein